MKKYTVPEIEIIKLDASDILTASTCNPETPFNPITGEEDEEG